MASATFLLLPLLLPLPLPTLVFPSADSPRMDVATAASSVSVPSSSPAAHLADPPPLLLLLLLLLLLPLLLPLTPPPAGFLNRPDAPSSSSSSQTACTSVLMRARLGGRGEEEGEEEGKEEGEEEGKEEGEEEGKEEGEGAVRLASGDEHKEVVLALMVLALLALEAGCSPRELLIGVHEELAGLEAWERGGRKMSVFRVLMSMHCTAHAHAEGTYLVVQGGLGERHDEQAADDYEGGEGRGESGRGMVKRSEGELGCARDPTMEGGEKDEGQRGQTRAEISCRRFTYPAARAAASSRRSSLSAGAGEQIKGGGRC